MDEARLQTAAAVILLAILASRPLGAARPIALDDYYRIETASTPAISPDGRWVVFVRNHTVESENRRHSELWIAPADGATAATRLTTPAFNASAPRWSPDGKLLAFRSSRTASSGDAEPRAGRGGRGGGGENDIWFLRMDRPSGEAFQIPGVEGMPLFSPDNLWIAFTRRTPPARSTRDLSPLEKQLEQRFKGRMYDWMNVRADGRGYLPDPRDPASTPPNELYIVAREGGTPRQVTHLGVDVREPAWRPDSGALALIADSHQRDEYSYERADLWVVAVDGQIRRLTDDGFEYDSPAWSPDGQSLIFRRRQGLSQVIHSKQAHGAAVDLYRMPAAGGALVNLTADWDLIPDAPVYSPDGRFVYFGAAVGGDTQLFRMAAAGGQLHQVTTGDRNFGGFSFSQSFDRMAYSSGKVTHPAEAFAARIDGSNEAPISALNASWINGVDLAPAERIHFPSKDGTQTLVAILEA